VVRSISELQAGEQIATQLADGTVISTVNRTEPNDLAAAELPQHKE
jgi:exonuclease VII large subunit